jgi:FkbM family methyltransferase
MKLKIESIKNRIKSYLSEAVKRVRITHKLDYDKYPIYLHDNIRLNSCSKEPDTVRWIEGFDRNDTAFDIGANIGAYSLIMAKYAKRVFSFEPSVFTFSTLVKNIYTNKASNIVPVNIALSSRKKIGEFAYSSTELGSSVHGLDVNLEGEAYRQQILSCSIDDFVADFGIEAPNHIKLDVDGAEFDILKGATRTISASTFKSLMVEADDERKKMFGFLESLGLKQKARYHIGNADMYNCLFIRR